MNREENLRNGVKTQINTLTASEKGKKGGKRSGEVRAANKQRRADLLALFGVEPLSAAMVKQVDCILLAMNTAQLKKLAADEDIPTYMRRRARLLLQQDDELAFDVSERMLDRAFGKPKQAVEMDMAQKPPIMILPDEIEDATVIEDGTKLE